MTECASSFLSQLRQEGFSLRVEGERLMVSPSSRLTDSQKEEIGLHKPALLALLADEEEWERQTALLATAEPVWAGSPVQMVTVAILRWYDAAGNVIHEAALPAEEDTRLLEGFRQLRTLREIGRGCSHPEKEMVRVGPHVMERCKTCGKNARGPGIWVPRSEITDPGLLPQAKGRNTAQRDLFAPDEKSNDARA